MNKLYILFVFCFLGLGMSLFAQESSARMQPDLQTTEFFDPTKEKEVEPYVFSTDWRLEVGYAQLEEQMYDTTTHFQHGMRVGATIDFNLPHRFSIQTGALATFTYGVNDQHWRSMSQEATQVEVINNHILQLQLTIPVRAYYNIKLWKKLNMFFYAGPQLQIGLTNYDIVENNTSAEVTEWLNKNNIATENHERYLSHELYRTNIQFGLGGGMEWDRYRVQAGYDFGLNNLLRSPVLSQQKLHEWGWMATFAYRL